jgi:hypothetical protein
MTHFPLLLKPVLVLVLTFMVSGGIGCWNVRKCLVLT